MTDPASRVSPVTDLEHRLGASWPQIAAARQAAREKRDELAAALAAYGSEAASIVVFGSLARDELTAGSDIDWTLLIDGAADPGHLRMVREIARHVREVEGREPGPEGTFGQMAFSHDLVHQIGGEDDTNSNTTRRILLLLESAPIGASAAYDRVLDIVVRRYLDEDRGLWYGRGRDKIPRFLLNDIVRYWRTIAVDFAYKQRSRGARGWALRNVKLRTSRKLIFVAGLLTCFSLQLEMEKERREAIVASGERGPLIEHLTRVIAAPPLEILARALLRLPELDVAAKTLFDAYDELLGVLADSSQRERLKSLDYEDLEDDEVFARCRGIASRFQRGLGAIFLDPNNEIGRLTVEYGVF